ncbi:hypothetical protein [Pseudoalteromonas sp. SK20]|nr:hypothetical protein [Pseudoalteromonas sp. SK20]
MKVLAISRQLSVAQRQPGNRSVVEYYESHGQNSATLTSEP